MARLEFITLNEAFTYRATDQDTICYIEASDKETQYTFADLKERALSTLAEFQRHGLSRGDELIFFLRSNQLFIEAFWACILGGITPVPVAIGISDEHHSKVFRIFTKLKRPHIYTQLDFFGLLEKYAANTGKQHDFTAIQKNSLIAEQLEPMPEKTGETITARPEDIAFIQFSSGSTREPKGVVLTHANLMANIHDIGARAQHRDDEVALSWMPLTHDMGLIGFHLSMLVYGVSQNWIPTDLFSRRPLLWMDKVNEKRANLLGSPNFGYRHYLKMLESKGSDPMDLSCVRLIYNGAEPISVSLCEEFLSTLAPHGLPANSMYCCYGLAEASLAVSLLEPGNRFEHVNVERAELRLGEPVPFADNPSASSVSFVMNGRPVDHCEVQIGDDNGRDLGEDVVGEIQMRGPNVTGGYYQEPPINETVYTEQGFLKTGDLGFMHRGQLVITGRLKDIIFVNGQNFYPHDLEAIALELGQCADQLELGKLVVSASRSADAEHDDVLVFVLHRGDIADFEAIARDISHTINEHAGVEVKHVIPVKRIPKTTSGKVQRRLLESDYRDGEYDGSIAELEALLHPAPAAYQGEDLSPIEQQLLTICHSVNEEHRLAKNDNLFEIGYSSLDLAQIHEQIDQLYPGHIDVTEIFDHPSVAELAQLLESKIG